ncbi:MAG: hypothetical protein GY842_18965 [bacterium]|nr:hypothetical protein [bacterium]
MEMTTFTFTTDDGWSTDAFPQWDSDRTLVFAFASARFLQETAPLRELAEAYPQAHIIGCSTSGEIFQDRLQDDSVSVGVIRFSNTRISSVSADAKDAQDSHEAGASLARQLLAPDLRGVVVVSEGLKINGSELIRGINSVLPSEVVVTGGLAGDGDRFTKTWVLNGGQPEEQTISAVGFYGDAIRIGHGSRGGWDVFGPERRVTRSQGNVLYELDGDPALPLYKKYLGDLSSGLPATALLFPLAMRPEETAQKSLVRTVLAVDESEGSMTFAADIPEGSLVQLMRANMDRLITSASESALMTIQHSTEPGPVFSIAISCVGRRLVLGERAEEEIESVLDTLPTGSKQVGFYSYGEISPYTTGHCDLHNQTMTLTTIAEAV